MLGDEPKANRLHAAFETRGLSDIMRFGRWSDDKDTPMQRLVATGTTAPLKPGSLPPIIMGAIDGLLRTFVDHATATAKSPQPFLALGAALCCIGAAAGRRYRSETNIRTNIMVIGLADSGGGKEVPRALLAEVFIKAEMINYLGGSRIGSSAGLLTALKDYPVKLFALDEIGHMLAINAGRNAGSHKAEILPLLTELYSKAAGTYLGTNYSDSKLAPQIIMHEPHIALYGVTVPGTLWTAFGSGALSDGSLARFLVFQSPDDYPDTQKPQPLPLPEDLVVGMRRIAGLIDGDLVNVIPQMSARTSSEVVTVPSDGEADDLLESLDREQLTMLRMHKGTSETSFWARFCEHIIRVAMIAAISRDPEQPRITKLDVRWARAIVTHCVENMLSQVGDKIADSEAERSRKEVAAFIRKAGKPVTLSALARGIRRIDGKTRNQIIADLIVAGEVISTEQYNGGRPEKAFTWLG